MKPEEIQWLTKIVKTFAEELQAVTGPADFAEFLGEWKWCLDDESKHLVGDDWTWLCPLIKDCRSEKIFPEDKHRPAMALSMPGLLMELSILSEKYKVSDGCIFIQGLRKGLIDKNYKSKGLRRAVE